MYEPLAGFRPIAISISRSISRALNETIGSAYNPLSLFAAGEQGVWYDPSDMSTLFQDAAGTIPVTAAGQPVGRVLDKSGRGNHATQATATSRPILQFANGLWSLLFDGVDDGLVTGNINFTATDKMTVWVGVRKASDALASTVCELSVTSYGTSGSFALFAPLTPNDPSYSARSGGTVRAAVTHAPFPSPHTAVLTEVADIAAPSIALRVNTTTAASDTTSQGTGAYGNLPLHIGIRGGTTIPFNGRLYGLIVRGVKSTNTEVAQTETYMNSKTGAY